MQAIEELLHSDIPQPINTYGPLIHNERVLAGLKDRGIGRIERVADFSGGSVVFRTHGVRPEDRTALEGMSAYVVDLTCPRVLRSQQLVAEAAGAGIGVILVGDRNHGEITSIEGFAPGCRIIRTSREAEAVRMNGPMLVVGQTTLRREEYQEIGKVLKRRNPRVKIAMTLCPATVRRQNALTELARTVDAVLVIGGKNSANTGRLYRQAVETGRPAWHIEGGGDLPPEIFGFYRVGLTAGASTPDWIVEEVEGALRGGSHA